VTKEQVCERIREIGILPAIRVASADDALFAARQMLRWGIPIVELTMTVPGAIGVLEELGRTAPELIVGAGSVLDVETARVCMNAGAAFITSPGFDAEIVDFTVKHKIAAIPGALTPSEIMRAHKGGADIIKIFPCAQVGGPEYIGALRNPFPQVALIASGGVNQQTAGQFIHRGATALGIGGELIPREAIERRDENWIRELAARFLRIVAKARAGMAE
jgi:2-dehydro-3-deoxyphosphogluconate aldolase/(4S)-4-hydroxy-2-oxoglutarate aldolase